MRVLVCGGRDFMNHRLLNSTLDRLHAERNFTWLINGAAQGADRLALRWAIGKKLKINSFCPDWKSLGKAAGPIRNQQMVDIGKPDLVVAFPGGKGTADMIARARKAGVKILEISAL